MKQNKASVALAVCVAMGLAGCASTPTNQLSDIEIHEQRQSALGDIQKRRASIKPELEDRELKWFATQEFERAEAAWQRAEEQFDIVIESPEKISERLGVFNSRTRGQVIDEGLSQAADALNKANVIRAEAQLILAEGLSNDRVLKELDVEKYYNLQYRQTRTTLKSLVDAIARDRKTTAINGLPALLRVQREVEVRTVRAIYLTGHEKGLRTLRREFIHQVAPQTFKAAQTSYDRAHAFIAEEPRNKVRIEEYIEATRFDMEHARHIGEDVKFLQAHEAADYERYLLNFEKNLNRIRQALEMDDLRDVSIARQAEMINTHIQEQQQKEQPELVAMRERLAEIQAELDVALSDLEEKNQTMVLMAEQNAGYKALVEALQAEREEMLAAQAETEEFAEAEEVAEVDEVVEAEEVAEVDEVVEAEEVAEVDEVVEAEEVAEVDEVVEAEEVAEVDEVVEAEEVAEIDEVVEAEEVAEVDEVAEMEETVEAETPSEEA